MFASLVTSILVLSAYSLFQVLSEHSKTASRRYLLAVIVLLALSQVPPLIIDILFIRRRIIIEMLPLRHWVFLIGPAVFLYARACMGGKSSKKDLLHLLPALLWWGVFLATLGGSVQVPLLPQIYGFTCIASLLGYGLLLQFSLSAYKRRLRDQYSYRNIFLEIKWLSHIAVVLVVITVAVALTITLLFRTSPPEVNPVHELVGDPQTISVLHSLAVLVFLFIFTLMAQKQEIHTTPLDHEPEDNEPDSSQEEPDTENPEFERLMLFMKSSRIYLDSTLSLQKLSHESGIGRHELSRLINSRTGGNFFHFINGFRAREFYEIIECNRFPHYNLLSMAYECGFNSKAPFNAAIKREFNKTPSQLSRDIRSAL